jgi:hypothetical protein
MRYKLRNGFIVEKIAEEGMKINDPQNGWYKIISRTTDDISGEKICLLTMQSTDPLDHTGGSHGADFDVVGEG